MSNLHLCRRVVLCAEFFLGGFFLRASLHCARVVPAVGAARLIEGVVFARFGCDVVCDINVVRRTNQPTEKKNKNINQTFATHTPEVPFFITVTHQNGSIHLFARTRKVHQERSAKYIASGAYLSKLHAWLGMSHAVSDCWGWCLR